MRYQKKKRPGEPSKLYVGNLAFGLAEADLRAIFAVHGTVRSAEVITDSDTGLSRGFGFIQMNSAAETTAAIKALNGKKVAGRQLTVNRARPRQYRGCGSGGSMIFVRTSKHIRRGGG
jgi:RNA recognition motif-containing protein